MFPLSDSLDMERWTGMESLEDRRPFDFPKGFGHQTATAVAETVLIRL